MTGMCFLMSGHVNGLIAVLALKINTSRVLSIGTFLQMHLVTYVILEMHIALVTELPTFLFIGMKMVAVYARIVTRMPFFVIIPLFTRLTEITTV